MLYYWEKKKEKLHIMYSETTITDKHLQHQDKDNNLIIKNNNNKLCIITTFSITKYNLQYIDKT